MLYFDTAPLGYKFKQLNDLFTARMNQELREQDLTYAQLGVLFYLLHHPEQKINQQILADALSVSHPTMVGTLSRMEEKGLLLRVQDQANRRSRIITLTEIGHQRIQQIQASHDRMNQHLMDALSEEEQYALNQILNKIYGSIKEVHR